jgi:hypothetical protein
MCAIKVNVEEKVFTATILGYKRRNLFILSFHLSVINEDAQAFSL